MPSPTSQPRRFGDVAPSSYPGERLGLPEEGHSSIARPGRRMLGIIIDWAIAWFFSFAFFQHDSMATLIIFAIMQYVFCVTIGGSIGHRVVGLRLVALSGGWAGLWRPAVRTVLLCVVVPALVWDSDQRGFHDKVAGTVLLRA